MTKKNVRSNFLSYLNLYSSQFDELLKKIEFSATHKKSLQVIFTPNPEQVVLAEKDKSFAEVLCQADYLVPDGVGLVIASRLFSLVGKGDPIKARIPGVELVSKLLHQAEQQNQTVMVIGGKAYNSLSYKNWSIRDCQGEKATKATKKTGKNTLWWTSGYVNAQHPTTAEHTAVLNCIQSVAPDILFVALGAPTQEKWVIENKTALKKAGLQVVMVVGGAFDMLLGKVERAPQWMRSMGLEWLYRLIQEPWRWRRQMSLLAFIKLVFRELIS